MTTELTDLSRAEIRAFVEQHRATLELAQAENRLPQFRLDLRDRFEEACAPFDAERQAKALRMFDEEVDAFCQQLRIGGVVVTSQVERVKPVDNTGRWLAAWGAAAGAFFISGGIAGAGHMSGLAAVILMAVITGGTFWLVKPKGHR